MLSQAVAYSLALDLFLVAPPAGQEKRSSKRTRMASPILCAFKVTFPAAVALRLRAASLGQCLDSASKDAAVQYSLSVSHAST